MTRRGFNETNVRGNFHIQVMVGTRKVVYKHDYQLI